MKKLLIMLLLFSTSYISAELIIKVVSGQEILSQLEEGKNVEKKLMAKRQVFESDIKALEADMEKIINEVKRKGELVQKGVMKQDALNAEQEAAQEKLMKMRREHQNKAKEAEEELKRAFQKELGKLNQKIQAAVMKVAEKNKWDIVSLKETGEVVYASPKVDASSDIVTLMNREFAPSASNSKK
jgi:outer membrane protein